jgi:hypothetical protein
MDRESVLACRPVPSLAGAFHGAPCGALRFRAMAGVQSNHLSFCPQTPLVSEHDHDFSFFLFWVWGLPGRPSMTMNFLSVLELPRRSTRNFLSVLELPRHPSMTQKFSAVLSIEMHSSDAVQKAQDRKHKTDRRCGRHATREVDNIGCCHSIGNSFQFA